MRRVFWAVTTMGILEGIAAIVLLWPQSFNLESHQTQSICIGKRQIQLGMSSSQASQIMGGIFRHRELRSNLVLTGDYEIYHFNDFNDSIFCELSFYGDCLFGVSLWDFGKSETGHKPLRGVLCGKALEKSEVLSPPTPYLDYYYLLNDIHVAFDKEYDNVIVHTDQKARIDSLIKQEDLRFSED